MSAAESTTRAAGVIDWLRAYSPRIDRFTMDERRCIPPHIVLDFGNVGLLGLQGPLAHGGLDLTHSDAVRVAEQLGAIDTTLALFVGVHNALGTRPIARFGTQALRAEALPLLATGRVLGAFALTEPGAGSNPRAIQATGSRQPDGTFALSGVKWWSGNAAWAGWINTFVRLPGACDGDTLTGFALRQGTAGLRQGLESLTMGVRGMTQNVVHMEGARASEAQMLGAIGQGMQVASDAMSHARLGIAAIALGAMKRCAQLMLGYADARVVGAGQLIELALTQERLGFVVSATAAVEALITFVASDLDRGRDLPPELFLVCKTVAPDLLWETVDHCLQMHGGRGYSEENPIAHVFRDARLLRIFEGPTETLNHSLGVGLLSAPERGLSLLRSLGGHAEATVVERAIQDVASSAPQKSGLIRIAADVAGEMFSAAVLAALATRANADSEWVQQRLTMSASRFRQRVEAERRNVDTLRLAVQHYSGAVGGVPPIDYKQ